MAGCRHKEPGKGPLRGRRGEALRGSLPSVGLCGGISERLSGASEEEAFPAVSRPRASALYHFLESRFRFRFRLSRKSVVVYGFLGV